MEDTVRVLASVADALFPPLKDKALESERAGDELSAQLYAFSGGSSDDYMLRAVELIETRLTPEGRKDLKFLLRLLGSRWGSILVMGFQGGQWGLPLAFVDLPRRKREAVLQQWARSPNPKMRKAFKGIKSVIMSSMFSMLGPDGTSPLLAALRYPIVDPRRPPAPSPKAVAAEADVRGAITDLSPADDSPGGIAAAGSALDAKGLNVIWPTKVTSPAAKAAKPHLVVQCDAVVVGSGAGGGVAAAQLAAAGLQVVVLEKASFVAAQDMTLKEGEAFQTMYENGGFLSTEDGTVSVLAGSTVGGGTRINWCASFKTPPHVRKEWAEKMGLPDFVSPKYDRALEAVWRRLSVHTGFQHSLMCSALREGLEVLGAHNEDVPRNCLSADCSGHCGFGCARGYKQDVVNTFLSDACHQGAQVLTGVWTDKVLTEANSGASDGIGGGAPRKKRTVGVLALAGNADRPLRLVVKAPIVVSACGSIHSPALLLRSGISCRGNVGANLRLHPCTCVVGILPPDPQADAAAAREGVACSLEREVEEEAVAEPKGDAEGGLSKGLEGNGRKMVMSAARHGPGAQARSPFPSAGTINGWEGTLMSVFSNEVAHWENCGYGALLYTPSIHPALFAVAASWVSGEDFKDLMLQFNNACTVLVLVRDQASGRVVIDRRGMPRMHYTIAPADQKSVVEGLVLGLHVLAGAGAQTVMTLQQAPDARFTFDTPHSSCAGGGSAGKARAAADLAGRGAGASRFGEGFEAFVERVQERGVPLLEMPLFSAHQMGTCRLGADPKDSVLDPQGECWEAAGLYCCDASTFPSPTGLNPMITIEAISFMLAEGIAERTVAVLKKRGKWKAPARRGASGGVQLGYEQQAQARL